jgi:hypothetical protein
VFEIALASAAISSLTVALLIETLSWWIRGKAPLDMFGTFVSRSNIFLYGGRLFALIFTSIIAFSIEMGNGLASVMRDLAAAFAIATLFHTLLLLPRFENGRWMRLALFLMHLPNVEKLPTKIKTSQRNYIISATALASMVFAIGNGSPLILATLVPEFRLSISGIGQIINAAGTFIILFIVDQIMFKSMDKGELISVVRIYTIGRIMGLGISALLFLTIGILV